MKYDIPLNTSSIRWLSGKFSLLSLPRLRSLNTRRQKGHSKEITRSLPCALHGLY